MKMLRNMMIVALVCSGVSAIAMDKYPRPMNEKEKAVLRSYVEVVKFHTPEYRSMLLADENMPLSEKQFLIMGEELLNLVTANGAQVSNAEHAKKLAELSDLYTNMWQRNKQ